MARAAHHGDGNFLLLAGAGVAGLALYNHFRPQIDSGLATVTGLVTPGATPTPTATPAVLQPATPTITAALPAAAPTAAAVIAGPGSCPQGYIWNGSACVSVRAPAPTATPAVLQPATPPITASAPTITPSPGDGRVVDNFPPPPVYWPPPAPVYIGPTPAALQPATPPIGGAAAIIAADYNQYLHRTGDTAGAAYWVSVYDNQVADGVSPDVAAANIAAAFANSAEAQGV